MIPTIIKRLLFFWLTSFCLATACYYVLWVIMPGHQVFGRWIRMIDYHNEHPIQYISIPCFFYGIIATMYANKFQKQSMAAKLLSTAIIIVATVIFSSPFGGMLWYLHDMQAGFFPKHWKTIVLEQGTYDGLLVGWVIVLGSFPYNITGVICTYFLTQKGASLFSNDHHPGP